MGGACCVAARDKTIVHGSSGEVLNRNSQCSPTWSFRWDNRGGRVAGEDTSIHWLSDGISRNDGSRSKSACSSHDGRQFESFQRCVLQKFPVSEDQSISRNISMDTSLECAKIPCHVHPAEPPSYSPQNQLTEKASDGIPGLKSSNCLSFADKSPATPSHSHYLPQGCYRGSSDSWSRHAFPELVAPTSKNSWSLDNEALTFQYENTNSYCQIQAPQPDDAQTCRVCLKLLTERSLRSSRKLVVNNELSVVAVLTCGHVYHAECLETLTPEIDKYDPSCPICIFGEKQTLKLCKKALKEERVLKAKNKKSKKRIVDSDLDGESLIFDHQKTHGYDGKGTKMASSSSMKVLKVASSSSRKTSNSFLRRHFSFGSKESRPLLENQKSRNKGFFWTKSVKA